MQFKNVLTVQDEQLETQVWSNGQDGASLVQVESYLQQFVGPRPLNE